MKRTSLNFLRKLHAQRPVNWVAGGGGRYATFAAWRRRHECQQPLRVESPAWLEAVTETCGGEEAVTLRLPGGATVEIARLGNVLLNSI